MENQDAKYIINIQNGENINIGDQSQMIRRGFIALATLMSDERVYDLVLLCRSDFKNIYNQIDLLRTYKKLHDILHTIEFHCYRGIVQEARHFPQDLISIDTLIEHKFTLEHNIDRLQDISSQVNFQSSTISCLPQLEEALEKLENAIEHSDKDRLQKAIKILNRVLAIHPSQINTTLNVAAKSLYLSNLIKSINSILDNLVTRNLESDKIERLKNSVEALDNLQKYISILIKNHDDWQLIDLNLRLIEATIDRDYLELEQSWIDLKAMIEKQCGNSEENWAQFLRQDGKSLETALFVENQNLDRIKRCFRSYRRRASNYFYKVDQDLLRLFEDLRVVDEPLTCIIEMIVYDGIKFFND
ncbi:hypothetical protein [Merismopedia glauca]|uniref:Uncharacterized protein n=1 Tax=Merismopedia glauca CCAP 1448/3 TaxID=1296344 RepID=A0A2T1C9Q1_9CYAN|nr:hypothetical protein [Merismopedia glauca]PSB04969.1 hypothetical protein C7B64_01735 [Merismopedia glauca CCAP 1448/3]